jgi:hypothetical protein
MGIEDDIKEIKHQINDLFIQVTIIKQRLDVNLPKDRSDNEKRIKDSIRGQLTDIDTNSETDTL